MNNDLRLDIDVASLRDLHDEILVNSHDLKIRKTKEYFESIIRCMPGNVYWMNIDCTTIGCNQNVLEMFGLERHEDFLGLTFEDMRRLGGWSSENSESFERDTLAVLNSGVAKRNIEEPPIPSNCNSRKLIYFLSTRMPVFNTNNKVIGVVGISTDITTQKEHEFALKKAKEQAEIGNRIKTEFLANMNHDIKTPLSSLISFIDILGKKTSDQSTKALADNSMQCATQLKNLINDILEASDIEVEGVAANTHKFSIKQLFEEIFKLMQLTTQIRGLKLSIEVGPKVPESVIGYKHLLKRALLNLVDNAIKFTDSGTIRLSVVRVSNKGGRELFQFSVADEGPGIPADKQDIIFEQFERLSPSYMQKTPGSGLGLYIVKRYVEKMGGEICVESEIGKGSKFILMLPLEIAADFPKRNNYPVTEFDRAIANRSNPIKLLLVEDNGYAQKVAELLTASLNIELSIAATGEDAISSFKNNFYDLIILDIGLPDMTGFDVSSMIRNIEAKQNSHLIPIVALTAHYDAKEYEACLQAGIQEVFSKPMTIDILQSVISRWID